MDSIDRKILARVQEDATVSIADLAATVGLSTTPCWRRLRKLEAAGVITRRVALVDPEKVGLGLSVFVSIRTNRHSIEWMEKFTRAVTKLPEVVEFYRLAGENDYLLRVLVRDIPTYDAFYKRLIRVADLANVTSSFAMEQIKYTTAVPVEGAE
ncbi:MAG: Lrp/AsnC family transcriptional regulator [Alphaproteobacteria bacterium]|nr:Lrp/AsnC family transcriptional regulator [Alphaproteobacteria bacterium]